MSHDTDRRAFGMALTDWFARCGRDYPWRRTTDPWAVLVSEVMLQQTTVPTVLARYAPWLQRFPTPAALAQATEQEALRSWEGLGYYRRVRSLQAAARAVTAEYGGVFPEDEAALRALPGIGEYTAAALLSFAYNKPSVPVDANVVRVTARVYNERTPTDTAAGQRLIRRYAEELMLRSAPRAYNSAVMELGQTYCTPGQPRCAACPVRAWCRAEAPEQLPVRRTQRTTALLEHWDIWCCTQEGLLLHRQPPGTRHADMYRLPRRPQTFAETLPRLCDQHYTVTRYKVTRHVHLAVEAIPPAAGEEFHPLCRLQELPLASPDRKLISRYLQQMPPAAAARPI